MVRIETGEDMKKWYIAFSVMYNTPGSLRRFIEDIEAGHGQERVDEICRILHEGDVP